MYLKELSLATVLIKLLCTLLRPYLICIICPYIREDEEKKMGGGGGTGGRERAFI